MNAWRGETVPEIGWMVQPAFQGRGTGEAGVRMAIERAARTGRWQVLHTAHDVAFRGRPLRCNHWWLDVRSAAEPAG